MKYTYSYLREMFIFILNEKKQDAKLYRWSLSCVFKNKYAHEKLGRKYSKFMNSL